MMYLMLCVVFNLKVRKMTMNLATTNSLKLRGDDFASTFEAEFNPNNSRLAMGGGLSDRMRTEKTMDLHRQMHKTGWEKATVINMHNFQLRHGMGNIGELIIGAKKDGEPYKKHVITHYRISMRDLGDAKFVPEAVVPVQMAEDICLMAKEFGGVFWYRGDGEPSSEEIENALNTQMEFFKKEYTKGLDIWNSKKQISLITDHMRSAAKALFAQGGIEKLPEWVSVTRLESERKMCDNCGNDIKIKAKTCSYCGFIIDLEFFKANQERFGQMGVTQHNAHRNERTPVDPIDEITKNVDEFFREEDKDVMNQVKNLDAALGGELPKDLPQNNIPKQSTIKPLRGK